MAKAKKNSESSGYVVTQRFRDSAEYAQGAKKTYEVGDDVSHFEEGRLKALLEKGLVEAGSAKEVSDENPEA